MKTIQKLTFIPHLIAFIIMHISLLNIFKVDPYIAQKSFHFAHVIGFVTWFAAMLYLGRLLVYQADSIKSNADDKMIANYSLMANRLYYYIAIPAMFWTLLAGIYSAALGGYFSQGWIHTKLTVVFFLVIYHHLLGYHVKKFSKNVENKKSITYFRVLNELGTVFLVMIASLAVFRETRTAMIATAIVILLGLAGYLVVRRISKSKTST